MASKHTNSIIDAGDFERLRKENASLREQLNNLREEVSNERQTHKELLESFKLSHHEDARKLVEERSVTNSLVKENDELRAEVKSLRSSHVQVTSDRDLANYNQDAKLTKLLVPLGKKLNLFHNELLSTPFMKSLQGNRGSSQGDLVTVRDELKQLNSELIILRSLLANKAENGPNGIVSPSLRGIKTQATPSNASAGNTVYPEDLVALNGPITEDAVLKTLCQRFNIGQNYTRLGSSVIAVNPYQSVRPGSEQTDLLQDMVQRAIQRLGETNLSQVIVLSGCSGSGKTHTVQLLMKMLLAQAAGGQQTDITKHLLASFAVLQSLGCSKTASNSDSSRVVATSSAQTVNHNTEVCKGHFLEFHLCDGVINKTKIQCYSLDSNRVVGVQPGEQCYHIFYELLAGITQEERAKLHIQGYSAYNLRYLSCGKVPVDAEEDTLKTKFTEWRASLATLGVPCMDVLRILVAVLLLGNVQFVEGEGVELDVKGNNEIKAVAALLGTSGVSLYRGLTTKTKSLRGQIFRSLCDSSTANYNRDVLAKALYTRTVGALVRRVNSFKRPNSMLSVSPQGSVDSVKNSPGKPASSSNGLLTFQTGPPGSPLSHNSGTSTHKGVNGLIGIVDMFGFENSQVNQLEHLCVNLCSETIQHFYNTHTFKSTEEYLREENLTDDLDIECADNAQCIELLTCQHAGILTILDDESILPRGNFQEFLRKVKTQHTDSECFFDPDPEGSRFGVSHFTEQVTYDARSLLTVNRDSIPDDIICVFSRQNCNFGFATHLFAGDLKTQQGQAAAPRGLVHRISPSPSHDQQSSPGSPDVPIRTFSQDFQTKLDVLLKTLVQAQPHFIRCIKANANEEAHIFDAYTVRQQLRPLQILGTLQLMQSAFAHRARYQRFSSTFRCLIPRTRQVSSQTEQDQCKLILEDLNRTVDREKLDLLIGAWVLGNRYLFYSEVVRQELEWRLAQRRRSAAVTVQAWVRGWIARKNWPHFKRSMELQLKARVPNRTDNRVTKTARPVSNHQMSPVKELQVDTSTGDQSCCLYGLDMETPPPVPKRRPYTVMGNMKMGFPQTRVMKHDYPQNGSSDIVLKKGEIVKVVSSSQARGCLVVEHKNVRIDVPFQVMELKASSPHASPRI